MKIRLQEEIEADSVQLENAKLLLVVKLLHELQHRATRLFLDLRCRRGVRSNSKLHTPESVRNRTIGGKSRGDSGYALEEKLLGGRLRHRHLVNKGTFSVSFYLLLCSNPTFTTALHPFNTFSCSQIQQIILMIEETLIPDSGEERWYKQQYVSKQLKRLEKGKT